MSVLTSTGNCAECDEWINCKCPFGIDSEGEKMSGISKDTFMEMSTDSKLGVLFDYMAEIQDQAPKRVRDRDMKCEKRSTYCNKRFGKVEKALGKYKVFNTFAAFIGGFVGGWSAVWTAFKLSLFN